jgi:hypothetical protein
VDGRDGDGRYLERWVSEEPPHLRVWRKNHVLSLTFRGDAHSIWLFWSEDWTFRGWYVQLQKPVVEASTGLETMDHALDVVVEPDGTWRWKDEDDLAEAIRLGVFTPTRPPRFAPRQHVIAAPPWPTGWEDWSP